MRRSNASFPVPVVASLGRSLQTFVLKLGCGFSCRDDSLTLLTTHPSYALIVHHFGLKRLLNALNVNRKMHEVRRQTERTFDVIF